MKKIKRITALFLACLLVFITGYGSVSAEETADAQKETLVSYLVVQEPMVTTPGTQTIMLGIGDGTQEISSAGLFYRDRETDQVYEADAEEISGDFVLFQMEYPDESQAGTYQLERIAYTAEEKEYEVSFEEMGIDAAFGVNQAVKSEPDDVLLTDEEVEALASEAEMSIVSLDEAGRPVSGETMEEALDEAGCSEPEELYELAGRAAGEHELNVKRMKSMVVVLDAGHGGSDPGAQANGVVEKIVNLKIAQYCKAELEQYAGIEVYMTRTKDTAMTLAQRAQVAINKRADLFVSLHNNSNTSPTPCGANVYYPNSNYNANCGTAGRTLAAMIESKLTDLGLASGGIHIRNSENGTKYPDGSLADYYGVIKRCKENGIPALIVEHAFISNAGDANKFLSSDEQLKKLGVADATAIAEYYGLKKGLGFNSIQSASGSTMDLSWTAAVGVTGYSISRSTSSGDGFKEVAKVTPATTTSWKDTGLSPGTTYYYKIRTYKKTDGDIKYGQYSAVASGTTMSTPVISSIKAKDSKTLVISWATINNAANYEVYRASKKNGSFKKIATLAGVNQVTYTDKVKAGKLYYYKIRSVGMVDNTTVYSDYSEVYPARTATIPKDVFVKSEGTKTLRVSWTPVKNASGYVIKRAESAKGKYKKIATVKDGAKKYYDDASVKAKKTYYYKVQSFNYNQGAKGVSGYGKAAYGKTINKTDITKIVNNSPTSQTISWKKASGIDGYVIYQSTSKNGTYKKIKKLSAKGKTSYKINNLTPGTRYYYKVRTRKKVNGKIGYGSYSAARNVWTPKAPEITAVQGVTGKSLQIFWNPSGGVESYRIYRADAADGAYTQIAAALDTQVSYTDTNLDMTKQYFYKIEAFIKSYKGKSISSGVSAAAGGSPVQVTRIISAAVNGQGQLAIAWDAVSDVAGYQIYRSADPNGTYALLQTITDPAASGCIDAAAEEGVVYYYKIALIGQYGGQTVYGPQSEAVSGIKPKTS